MLNGEFDEVSNVVGLIMIDFAELKLAVLVLNTNVAHLAVKLAGQAEDVARISTITK